MIFDEVKIKLVNYFSSTYKQLLHYFFLQLNKNEVCFADVISDS